MVIISDTSPIANLIVIGQLDFLRDLFSEIIIPEAVNQEILFLKQSGKDIQAYENADWLKIKNPQDEAKVESLRKDLDAGEAEAIVLALELECDLLLIDERLGNKIAAEYGLHTVGLLGVLIRAKQKNIISEIKPLMIDLKEKAGFWIGQKLFDQILRDEGEI